jgi:hypothetical protein
MSNIQSKVFSLSQKYIKFDYDKKRCIQIWFELSSYMNSKIRKKPRRVMYDLREAAYSTKIYVRYVIG